MTDQQRIVMELLLEELDVMISNISGLPDHVKILPITHYDFAAALRIVGDMLKEIDRRLDEIS